MCNLWMNSYQLQIIIIVFQHILLFIYFASGIYLSKYFISWSKIVEPIKEITK